MDRISTMHILPLNDHLLGTIEENIVPLATGTALGAVSGALVSHALSSPNRTPHKRRGYSHRRFRRRSSFHRRRERYTPHTAGKRRDTSHRRIRYTRKGQPYVIVAHGRARFIKKSSAHRSHKLKGGRY